VITYPANSYCSQARSNTVYYCMPLDDGRMTETFCGNNIRRGEGKMLRWRTIHCWINRKQSFLWKQREFTTSVSGWSSHPTTTALGLETCQFMRWHDLFPSLSMPSWRHDQTMVVIYTHYKDLKYYHLEAARLVQRRTTRSIPSRDKFLLFSVLFKQSLGYSELPRQWLHGSSFPEKKRQGREPSHFHLLPTLRIPVRLHDVVFN
jgi:hypothetical protein